MSIRPPARPFLRCRSLFRAAAAGRALRRGLLLACCAAWPASAQTPPETADLSRGGFAPQLQARKPAPTPSQPYLPIRKQDDQAQVPEIEMFVGESRVFPSPGVARIAVGNGKVLTAAALDEREVIVFANEVGTSSLFVWNEDGRYQRVKINVVPGDTSRYAREIAAFLSTIANTKASIIGDKVIVEGDNLSDIDLRKIEDLRKHYPQIVNFTNQIGWEQMVLMDVKVVEFPVNELRELGLRWTAKGGASIGGIWSPIRRVHQDGLRIDIESPPITAADGDLIPLPKGLNILSALNMGLGAKLDLLASQGKASILAQPQLSARNGAKAEFLAGGEYPYVASSINGPTVMFKPYGIKLKITPRVDRNGVIRAEIDSEVSNIDPSISTAAGPALSVRRTFTEFNVQNGETMVLSGLMSRKTSQNIDKVPFLGDLPVLGALFRSKRFQNDETELVVFVTPTVINSQSPGLVQRIERITDDLRQRYGPAPWLDQPGPAPAHLPRLAPARLASADASIASAPMPAAAAIVRPERLATVPARRNPLEPPPIDHWRVVHDGLVLHAGPDAGSQALLQLGQGSFVRAAPDRPPMSDAHQGWRAVAVGALQGWVRDASLRPVAHAPDTSAPPDGPHAQQARQGQEIAAHHTGGKHAHPAPGSYRVALGALALRVAPDINAPVLQRLAQGSLLEVLPQAPQAQFSAVQVDGQRGWVETQWLFPAF
ncbi:pilus assembly protein N-terminal domain-containing protein [Verminephrobacter eiseniae]|uniref:pilus assembly protein N-terminal domain-containing protein n=2 Tax=Verminephrobacter eiseniae TaxID=364317 RepID=UPI0022380031|nr:pilus assembly protein N-terminal domain-containing protein [Verminephrobacter eiseniae]MCW5233065.1 type II and III secretion system protein [Verminephrobacter eiseniae]MCW5295379.1 type II and III secretion system protein [Verminephrobacter eiseniae]MCW8187708.1 type II and III secretion system protein [Verminephrobacter eiseniae]MCW8222940.1 type II and III secretion system protein [Verminephrobacter eiseniae]MCW8233142.1 type II and III secretion system protein [Verminephrobacter eiseni